MIYIMRYVVSFLVLFAVSTEAEAQKNCKKGIPCGNSCISASKTCRVGISGSAAPRYEPSAERAAPNYAAPAPPSYDSPDTERADSQGWVGLVNGKVYYRASCQAAKELPALIHFSTPAEAERLGYRRSKVPGC
jgi:hypothetical protein